MSDDYESGYQDGRFDGYYEAVAMLEEDYRDSENLAAELRAALGATVDAINGALIYHHHSLGNPVKKELNEAVNRAGRALAEGEKP